MSALPEHLVFSFIDLTRRQALDLRRYWSNRVDPQMKLASLELIEWSDDDCVVVAESLFSSISLQYRSEAQPRLPTFKYGGWNDIVVISKCDADEKVVFIVYTPLHDTPKIFVFATSESFWIYCVLKFKEKFYREIMIK